MPSVRDDVPPAEAPEQRMVAKSKSSDEIASSDEPMFWDGVEDAKPPG